MNEGNNNLQNNEPINNVPLNPEAPVESQPAYNAQVVPSAENIVAPMQVESPMPVVPEPVVPAQEVNAAVEPVSVPLVAEPSIEPSITPAVSPIPVDTTNVVEPPAAPAPVATEPSGPVYNAEPIPTTNDGVASAVLGGINPVPTNDNANAFMTPPVMESNFVPINNDIKPEAVGQIPPEKKQKKSVNKVVFTIIIILVIGAIGYGLYWYLSLPKADGVSVVLKPVEHTLGEELSSDINTYGTFNGINSSTCTLDTNDVDTSKAGEYEYSITCGDKVYTSKITVIDSDPIEVVLKNAYTSLNTQIEASEFIVSCNKDECTYEYAETTNISELIATEGDYEVDIIVKSGDTETTVKGELKVIATEIEAFFVAEAPSETMTNYAGTKVISDSFAISPDLMYFGISERDVVYTFTDETEYTTVKEETSGTSSFDGYTGTIIINDDLMTLTVKTALDKSTLDIEYGSAFPEDYDSIKEYYTKKGYTTFVRS